MRSPSGANAARGGKHTTPVIAGRLRRFAWWTSGGRHGAGPRSLEPVVEPVEPLLSSSLRLTAGIFLARPPMTRESLLVEPVAPLFSSSRL